jgi:hypothetical protein
LELGVGVHDGKKKRSVRPVLSRTSVFEQKKRDLYKVKKIKRMDRKGSFLEYCFLHFALLRESVEEEDSVLSV